MNKAILPLIITALLAGCGGGEEETTGGTSTTQSVTVGLSKSVATIKEGQSGSISAVVEVKASRTLDSDVTLKYRTEDGSAVAGNDYISKSGEIIISKGASKSSFEIGVIPNTIYQDNRSFKVIIESVTGNAKITNGVMLSNITIEDDDPMPKISFITDESKVLENIGDVEVKVSMDRLSAFPVSVNVTFDGLAEEGIDFSAESKTITIEPMTLNGSLVLDIISDELVEGTEDIKIAMQGFNGAEQGGVGETAVLISGDLKLPDTGAITYFNNGSYGQAASDVSHPYQDAEYGLDTDSKYTGNGHAGSVYQKIDSAGNPMAANVTNHSCVYDNHTGLTWEVKRQVNELPALENDNMDAIRAYSRTNWGSKRNRYLWRNLDGKTNGGSSGGINPVDLKTLTVSENCAFPDNQSALYIPVAQTGCVSDKYQELVNKAAVCGFIDWRLPSVLELQSIIRYENGMTHLDGQYFKDENYQDMGTMKYLTNTPAVDNEASVWCVDANTKQTELCNKQQYNYIRLVRGGNL